MSRQQVRQAIYDWVVAGNITNLNQVFIAFPKRINFEQNATAGQMSRGAGLIHITNESESRIAVGGASNGWKRIDYQISFQIFLHSMQAKAEDAMADYDAIVDSVKDRLRAGSHRLGQTDGTIIWQAAEDSISVQYGEPKTNAGGATEIWASVDFIVTQMIQA